MELRTRDIAFHGTGPATAPATWGQHYMWRNFQERKYDTAYYNQIRQIGVPDGLTVDGILDDVREILTRYESLRTQLFLDEGRLRQRLLPTGFLTIDVVLLSTRRDRTVDALIRAQRDRMKSNGFDITNEIPFRAAVVVLDGVPHSVIVCIPHTAADLHSLRILEETLSDLFSARARGEPTPPPTRARQPIEQAVFEASPAGQRVRGKSRSYLRRTIAGMPSSLFPAIPEPAPPTPYWTGEMRSRAAALASCVLGARYQTSTANVILTATVAVLSRLTHMPNCGLWLLVGNRTSPALRHSVGNVLQKLPVLVEVPDAAFADLIQRVWTASLRAYRHGQFAPDDLDGHGDRISCLYNDRRENLGQDARLAASVTPEDVRAALTDSVFYCGGAQRKRESVSIDVADTDTDDMISFSVTAGHCFMSRSTIWTFLTSVENLLTELVSREVTIAEVDAFVNGRGGIPTDQPGRP